MTLTIWQLITVCAVFFTSGVGVLVIAAWALWAIDKFKERKAFRSAEKTSLDGYQ